MVATRSGCRRWVFRSTAVISGLVVGALLAEAALRSFPGLLSPKLRHAAFSKYDTLPGGIFLSEGITRMRFMRAGHETRAYSHDCFWIHRTDRRGFRNPDGLTETRVLLLGDSLIYGHGVEGDQTVGHFLRSDHGVDAYDLSAQGRCLYEHYVTARLRFEELRPETVLIFFYFNDFRDLEKTKRTDLSPELQEIDTFDYELIRQRIEGLQRFKEPWLLRAAFSSSIVRLTAQTEGWRPPRPPQSTPPKSWRQVAAQPTQDPSGINDKGGAAATILEDARFRPVARYYDRVLGDLSRRCGDLDVRLVLVHLVPPVENRWPEREQAQAKLQALLENLAATHDLELIDTTEFFAGRTDWILAGDGHFNPTGNRELAAFLYRSVVPVS